MERRQAYWRFGVSALILLGMSVASQAEVQPPNDIRALVQDIRPIVPNVVDLQPDIVALDSAVVDIKEVKTDLDKSVTDLQGNSVKIVTTVTKLDKAMSDLGVKESETEIRVDLSSDILFDFDKWSLKLEAATALRQTALVIREKRKGKVRISGHTDSKGSHKYNQRLSERRAQSVKRWLADIGRLQPGYFDTTGFGELYPVAANEHKDGSDNSEGRAKNRRVEIIIETVQRKAVSQR